MQLAQIQTVVLDVLKEVQELCGRSWNGLDPSATPIGDLDGFDSLCSVEATVMVEAKLGCGRFKPDTIFVSEDGTRALSVAEVAKRIETLLSAPEKNK